MSASRRWGQARGRPACRGIGCTRRSRGSRRPLDPTEHASRDQAGSTAIKGRSPEGVAIGPIVRGTPDSHPAEPPG